MNTSSSNPVAATKPTSAALPLDLGLRLLAIFCGAISCITLARKGFDIDLPAFIAEFLDGFDKIVELLFGWFGRMLVNELNELATRFGWQWELTLYPHWRHVYIILQLYFLKDAAQFVRLGLRGNAATSYAVGLLAASMSAFCSGLIDPASGVYWRNLVICLIPIFGFFVYWTAMAWAGAKWSREYIAKRDGLPMPQPFFKYFGDRVLLAVYRTLTGAIVVAVGLLIVKNKSPAIFMLAFVWCLLALEWLRRGWPQSKSEAKLRNITLGQALLHNGNFSMGTDMLATVGLALTVLGVAVLTN